MKIIFNKTIGLSLFALSSLSVACGAQDAASGPDTTASAQTTETSFSVASAPLAAGLYQAAYSTRNDVLWVTSAVGRPPVKSSALIKVDPRTRQVLATYVPPVVDAATGGLEAVYGVAVDDEHDNVWVTNTRNGSVAVYNQSTGAHLATLPNIAHPREIIVDEAHNVAWASAFGGAALVAYDTETLQEKRRISVAGSGPAGLAIDKSTGTLYATDLNQNQIIEVALDSTTPRLVRTGAGPISIALSADNRTAYTADQGAGTLSVVDLASGTVTKTILTGAGALSAATDPASGKVVVANRGSATLSVVDVQRGVVTGTISTNANPNHVTFGAGSAFVVDKSGAGPDRKDTLYAVTFSH